MDSIVTEFNSTVSIMKKQMDTYDANHEKSKRQVQKIVEHNRRLVGELKQNIQAQLNEPGVENRIRCLERQLQEATQSKTSLIEMWQQATHDLEQQRAGVEAPRTSDAEEIEKQIAVVRSHYTKGLNLLSNELSETRSQLAAVKEELKSQNEEIKRNKSVFQKNEEALVASEKLISRLNVDKKEVIDKILNLETQLSCKERIIEGKVKDNIELEKENQRLKLSNKTLSEQASQLNNEKLAFEKDAKESLLAAEEAILQKKEVQYKEQLAVKCIQELKSSISQELQSATQRYRNEIKSLQKQAEEKMKSLMEEINDLQRENSEKQNAFERAVREKQAVESKLQVFNQNAQFIAPNMFDDLRHKLTLVEKARDEALFRVASLNTNLKDLQQSHSIEIEFLKSESKSWKSQFQKLQADLTRTMESRTELTELVSQLKRKIREVGKEMELVKSEHQKELSRLTQSMNHDKEMHKQQIKSTEEHYGTLISELQQLVEAQNGATEKWKLAAKELAGKSEIKVREMYHDIDVLQKQNQELNKTLIEQKKSLAFKSIPLSLM